MERDRRRAEPEPSDGARRPLPQRAPRSAERVVALQRAAGNHAVERLLSEAPAAMVQAMRRGPLPFPRGTKPVPLSSAPSWAPGGQSVRAPSWAMKPQSVATPKPAMRGFGTTTGLAAATPSDPFAEWRQPTAAPPATGAAQPKKADETTPPQQAWEWFEWLEELQRQLSEFWPEVEKLAQDYRKAERPKTGSEAKSEERSESEQGSSEENWRFYDEERKRREQAEELRWAEFQAGLERSVDILSMLPVIDYENDDVALLVAATRKAYALFRQYAGLFTNIMTLLNPGSSTMRAIFMACASLFNLAITILDAWVVSEPPDPTQRRKATPRVAASTTWIKRRRPPRSRGPSKSKP